MLELLRASQLSAPQPRKAAELRLLELQNNEAFPGALATIGVHANIAVPDRLAALVALKNYVGVAWSPSQEDFAGKVLISDAAKGAIRSHLLQIVYDGNQPSKITASTAAVVAAIAKSDFPEQWPELLDSLLNEIRGGNDEKVLAILKVLGEIIAESLDEEQFNQYATPLMEALRTAAMDGKNGLMTRALSVLVFRSCFDFVENLKDKDEDKVKGFAKGVLDLWNEFFLSVIKETMPTIPSAEEENDESVEVTKNWRGVVALKIQVILVRQSLKVLSLNMIH